MKTEGKLHLIERDKVKPGDRVKFVDTLTLEERAEVEAMRSLGDSGVLDVKATMLEELAGAARQRANAAKLFETYPSMFPELPNARPTWALGAIVLNVLVLCAVIALATAQFRSTRPTLSAQESPKASPEAGEVVKARAPTQKGRGAR